MKLKKLFQISLQIFSSLKNVIEMSRKNFKGILIWKEKKIHTQFVQQNSQITSISFFWFIQKMIFALIAIASYPSIQFISLNIRYKFHTRKVLHAFLRRYATTKNWLGFTEMIW